MTLGYLSPGNAIKALAPRGGSQRDEDDRHRGALRHSSVKDRERPATLRNSVFVDAARGPLDERREARPDACVCRPFAVDRPRVAAATAIARDQVTRGRSRRIHLYLAAAQLVADVHIVRDYVAGKTARRAGRRIQRRVSFPAPVGSRCCRTRAGSQRESCDHSCADQVLVHERYRRGRVIAQNPWATAASPGGTTYSVPFLVARRRGAPRLREPVALRPTRRHMAVSGLRRS